MILKKTKLIKQSYKLDKLINDKFWFVRQIVTN